jgi:hypothetical protein
MVSRPRATTHIIDALCVLDLSFCFRKFDGTYGSVTQDTRTSHNTWCLDECYENELHQNVIKNVENITGIPDTNSEYWQFLQYDVGQFYKVRRGQ